MTKQLTKKNFDYSAVAEVISERWVYIFGMENEGDMFGEFLGKGLGLGDLYKIGTTINPIRRWRQVQVHSPWELRCFAVFPGGFDVESEMHRRLDEFRTRGEWFSVPRFKMVEFIDDLDCGDIGMTMFPSLPWTEFRRAI